MKRKALSLALALLLAATLLPAASGAEVGALSLSFNVRDAQALHRPGSMFQLRNWEWPQGWNTADWPQDAPATVKLGDRLEWATDACYELPLGACLVLEADGTLTSQDIQIIVWSDPDGDGVYEQRLSRLWTESQGTDNRVRQAVTDAGAQEPLTDAGAGHSAPWYNNYWTVAGENRLTALPGQARPVSSPVRLSAGYLTRLFGPGSLVEILAKWDGVNLGAYAILLTGEKGNLSQLNTNATAMTKGGALVSGWAAESVSAAEETGVIPDGLSGMDLSVSMTRAQFAAAAVRLYEVMAGQELTAHQTEDSPFTDVPEDHTYRDAIHLAYAMGFITGNSATTYAPEDTLTREQAAVILSRVYARLYGDIPTATATSFADDSSVGSWAKSGVAFMAAQGIVGGVGDNRFAPQQTLTGQEALTMAARMVS